MLMSYEEKVYMLQVLKQQQRRNLLKKTPDIHKQLVEKLEQSIRNENVNRQSFGKGL